MCATLALSSLVGAIPVKRECLSKIPLIAGTFKQGSETFDWTEEAVKEFHTQSFPTIKRSCLADNGDLNSFRMVIRGYDETSNLLSDSAGPSESGTCTNVNAPVMAQPTAGRIYSDSDRVQGVELYYVASTETLLIGKRAEDSITVVFNETHSFMGFFGT